MATAILLTSIFDEIRESWSARQSVPPDFSKDKETVRLRFAAHHHGFHARFAAPLPFEKPCAAARFGEQFPALPEKSTHLFHTLLSDTLPLRSADTPRN